MKLKKISSLLAMLLLTVAAFAGNTVTTVSQVTDGVTVSEDVDYVITDAVPFTTAGSVNITNTEHAVVIIKSIKPSVVISTWLKSHVYINGEQAVNNKNCQVKMYSHGAIIFPYASSLKPLTVYSEQNFSGESCNDFGLENSGGYMNTLSAAKLNNKIRSFKLKRGYMVTFSTRANGRGYSRCFIADKADLEFKTMPAVLDKTISSYRVFHWYNAKKAGLASDTRAVANQAVNASWCYDWALGSSLLPDVECVPNHIYEDWPSSSACGGVTYSCHLKTNNEPGNASDDHPQDVATVLANWENLMATGLRLCSESSHDGSMGHLKAFIDSIDARGWRCDILDLHCYWPSGSFNNLTSYSDNYGHGRPIWISEWVWGASWNRNGFWGAVSDAGSVSESNQNVLYDGTKPILDILNSNSRVERYAYWNSEAAGTHIYHDGALTKLGEYYANMDDDLGYNPANEYIPRNPRFYDLGDLSVSFDKNENKATLKWHDYNGEYNQAMELRVKRVGALSFSTLQSVETNDEEADYAITVDANAGDIFQVRIKDFDSKWRYSNEATVVNEKLEYGDRVAVSADDIKYLGGNHLINGDFEFGLADWMNGAGEPIAAPYYQVVPEGGVNGSPYLQCYGSNSNYTHAQSICKVVQAKKNTSYYVSAAGCYGDPSNQQVTASMYNSRPGNTARIKFPDVSQWTSLANTFTTGNQEYIWISLANLQYKAQFDEFKVCELFATREEAMADALEWTKKRAEAFKAYNTKYADLNAEIDNLISTAVNANEIEAEVMKALAEIKSRDAKALSDAIITDYEKALPFSADAEHYTLNKTLIKSPSFESTSNWTVKCGTYTGGDQRVATQAGKSCWNAWWNIPVAGNAEKTMAVKQTIAYNQSDATTNVEHGFYALECKATTQHLCENDQHAYLTNPRTKETSVSISLPVGKLDLPIFSDDEKWTTLATSYLYFNERDTMTVGFVGSKNGTTDKQWKAYGSNSDGDNREGWWCATDFQLRHIPAYILNVDATGWGTVCLPYSFTLPEGMHIYTVAGALENGLICLTEVTTPVAGTAYVYHCDTKGYVTLFESGDRKSSASSDRKGLYGSYVVTAASKYPVGALVVKNGIFSEVKERYKIDDFCGYIRGWSYLTVLSEWDGVTLPTEKYVASGIIQVSDKSSSAQSYDLLGRKVGNVKKGMIITNGKKIAN